MSDPWSNFVDGLSEAASQAAGGDFEGAANTAAETAQQAGEDASEAASSAAGAAADAVDEFGTQVTNTLDSDGDGDVDVGDLPRGPTMAFTEQMGSGQFHARLEGDLDLDASDGDVGASARFVAELLGDEVPILHGEVDADVDPSDGDVGASADYLYFDRTHTADAEVSSDGASVETRDFDIGSGRGETWREEKGYWTKEETPRPDEPADGRTGAPAEGGGRDDEPERAERSTGERASDVDSARRETSTTGSDARQAERAEADRADDADGFERRTTTKEPDAERAEQDATAKAEATERAEQDAKAKAEATERAERDAKAKAEEAEREARAREAEETEREAQAREAEAERSDPQPPERTNDEDFGAGRADAQQTEDADGGGDVRLSADRPAEPDDLDFGAGAGHLPVEPATADPAEVPAADDPLVEEAPSPAEPLIDAVDEATSSPEPLVVEDETFEVDVSTTDAGDALDD